MPLPNRSSLLTLGILTIAFLGNESIKELEPWTGTWEPVAAREDGVRIESEPMWRLWLDITPSKHATLATYWTCGAKCDTFAEGVMVVQPSEILHYKENWATRERAAHPSGSIKRYRNGRLGFVFHQESGKSLEVEFVRIDNATTVFDAFGWH